jgi:hypothetical protein
MTTYIVAVDLINEYTPFPDTITQYIVMEDGGNPLFESHSLVKAEQYQKFYEQGYAHGNILDTLETLRFDCLTSDSFGAGCVVLELV